MIEKKIAERFLGKYVLVYVDGKMLYGKLHELTDSALILKNKKFGITVRSLESVDGIEEKRNRKGDSSD